VTVTRQGQLLFLAATLVMPLLLTPLPGGAYLLPALAPLTLYYAFCLRVRAGDYGSAWRWGVAWAALLSAGVMLLVAAFPETARSGILHGEDYRQEMFRWIQIGQAPENDWRLFLPQHAWHLTLFVVLTWMSGGYLGLVLGAALIGYMSYFVASYAQIAEHPLVGACLAWVPWSILRVLSFVMIGSVLARPLLVRRFWPLGREEARWLALAAMGLLADVVIKGLLAPRYGLFLRDLAGSSGLPL
jgi:hypothetical protein